MNITAIILLTVLALGIITDVILALLKNTKTYSRQISEWAFGKWPSVNFMLSFLLGHFFWPYVKVGVPFLVSILVGLAFMGIIELVQVFNKKYPKWCFVLFTFLGYLIGGLFF